MGELLDFVKNLVEERVDLGGSQFSESILERSTLRLLHDRMWWPLEFGSPCSPHSPLFSHDSNDMINNGSLRSFTKCFYLQR